MNAHELTRLIGVLVIGFLLGSGISPLNAADPLSTTGEILKVCINTKTGAIRVASKCTSAERKTVLGGVGATGEKGDTGATGEKGDTGATGEKGDTGAQGLAGTNGINGATGATGPQGEKGLTGAQGPQGSMGATGSQGLTGPSGVSGLRTVRIDFLTGYYFNWCNGTGRTITLGSTLVPACSVTVYAP